MVKAENDDVKPIKSTIAVDNFKNDDGIDYFALSGLHGYEIKEYVADNFKKEITDLDILNFSLFLCNSIVTAESDDEKADLLNDLTDVINDKYKLNEYIFTNLAKIKAWNETVAEIETKYGSKDNAKDVSETEFNEIMKKYNEKNQYKAWNDERKILNAYSKKAAAKGVENGECKET